jgi:hypothetical protein
MLHDVVLTASQYCNILSIHMDKHGECCVSVGGEVNESILKRLMSDFDPEQNGSKSLDDYEPEYNVDYTYNKGNTNFYTKDGYDFREL